MPPKILILTPFRNEDHAIPYYLKSLESVDYPKNLIDVFWLENDSSDKTLNMLKNANPKMPFNSTTLKSINILGPLKKRIPGEYFKDLGHGRNRKITWPVIWNEHFLPLIRKSHADYVLSWYGDVMAPSNVINEFLEVFKVKKDAGWVGGANCRRYPRSGLGGPRPKSVVSQNKIVKIMFVGHCWMCPRMALAKTSFYITKGPDLHISLVKELDKQGLYVYYQPSIFLNHISTDGKTYLNKRCNKAINLESL